MAKRLVRQFKTQAAPADARGYQPQARFIYPEEAAPAPVQETTVINPKLPVVDLSNTPPANVLYAEDTRLFPPVETAQPPRTMGTPAMPPDWYPETPHRIWSPDATTGTRRNTGADDIYDTPPVQRPTITTTNTPISGGGIFPQTDPQIVEATLTPNVGVDTTAETYTLPPQQQIIHERPSVVDYGPITTPIERPIQEDTGYIDPQQPYTLTPGHQVVATETSSFEPQPIQSAYAAPIQVDYPQPQTQPPVDIPQDDVTALVDTILPEVETTAPKTLDLYQEGPQWVEDPQAAAAQEAIDQQTFTQTDPSIYQPQPTIDEAPEIIYTQPPTEEQPFVIDYSDTYNEPVEQEVYPGTDLPLPNYDRGVSQPVQRPAITQPPEMGAPIIPTSPVTDTPYGGSEDIVTDTQPIELSVDDQTHSRIGTGNYDIVDDSTGPVTDTTQGLVADTTTTTTRKPDERLYPHQEGDMRRDPENLESGPSHFVRDFEISDTGEGTPTGVGPVVKDGKRPERQRKEGPEYLKEPVIDDKEEVKGGPVTGGVQGETVEYDVDPRDFQDSRDLDQKQQDPELVDRNPDDLSGRVDQKDIDKTVTQPPVGGRKWLHTGPQDFAETRWQLFGAAQGDPIITHTPAVSGPQVNPQTGEITTEPLTWWQNRPAGSEVSPYTKGISTSTSTGAQEPPNITGVSPTSTTGGEGRTPLQTFLENQDNAGELIPGGLNLDAASLKHTAAVNQLRSSYNAKDFEGVDSFEKFGNLFETKLGLKNFGSGAASFIQELTGMQEGDLKGPGLWDTLNTPIPAFSTGEFGITPLDIITVVAAGTATIGPILMRKFMDSLLQPVTSAVGKTLKGVFDGVFNRGGQPTGDVAQSDINAADLAVLAEELGISKPAGMIEAGTYYGADGSVIARNMKPLDFGLNTVDGANSFKDVLHDIGTKADPGYTSVKYDTKTGQVDVVHADGTVTESASHITVDSDGNMQQGTGKSKKTKKVNWGVNVVGVESIDTVAPRKGKGKGKGGKSILDWIKDILGSGEDEDDGEDTPPSGK